MSERYSPSLATNDCLSLGPRISQRNNFRMRTRQAGWVALYSLQLGYPPYPPRYVGIITLAGNSRQNTVFKGLRYQNTCNKELRYGANWLVPTVTASTMIARFGGGHKVRCHMEAVGNILGASAEQFNHLRLRRRVVDNADRSLRRALLRRGERRADRAVCARRDSCAAGRGHRELGAGFHRLNFQFRCACVGERDGLWCAGFADGLLLEAKRRGGREARHSSIKQHRYALVLVVGVCDVYLPIAVEVAHRRVLRSNKRGGIKSARLESPIAVTLKHAHAAGKD